MRKMLFVSVVVGALMAQLSAAAFATGPGGWDHLGNGGSPTLTALNGAVYAMNSDNPGILYVGGAFTNAGGKANADYLAKWDGSGWSAVNGPKTLNGRVDAIAFHAGRVYVGGEFTNVGNNVNIDYLAEWTGTVWQSPCVGPTPNPITGQVAALQIIGNTLYVGGSFAHGGGIASAGSLVACDLTTRAARSTVTNTADAFNSGIAALTADSNGTLYAGGAFNHLEGVNIDHVAYYVGGHWHAMGQPHAVPGLVRSLAAHGTSVYIGTDSVNINSIAKADHIAKWDAQTLTFSAMGSDTAGTNGWFPASTFIYALATSGSLVFAAGSFQNADQVATADAIAWFDGNTWRPLGSDGAGNGALKYEGDALTVFDHRLVAGGNFNNAGGDLLADAVASYAIQRPDARIGAAASGPFVGDNVYSASGAGEARTISVQRGHSGTVYVDLQNDGLAGDTFTVTGPSGASGFTLTYFHGATNVTSHVTNGTFSTGNLTRGAHLTLKVVVKVAAGSASSVTFLITARSQPGSPVDAVKVTVNAT